MWNLSTLVTHRQVSSVKTIYCDGKNQHYQVLCEVKQSKLLLYYNNAFYFLVCLGVGLVVRTAAGAALVVIEKLVLAVIKKLVDNTVFLLTRLSYPRSQK